MAAGSLHLTWEQGCHPATASLPCASARVVDAVFQAQAHMQPAGAAALTGHGAGPDKEGIFLPVHSSIFSVGSWDAILELALPLNQMQHAFCF